MSGLQGESVYREIQDECTECGECVKLCPSLSRAGLSMGGIAKSMLEALSQSQDAESLASSIGGNASLVQAVRGCFLCTSCRKECPVDNDIAALIYAARQDFQLLGLIPRQAWSSVMVDCEWHIFTAYRAIYGIGYPDLLRHVDNEYGAAQTDCNVAFFPGCSLAAYSPDLTREVFAAVESLGGKTTLIDRCCGSPLRSAGFPGRADALCAGIAGEVGDSGAREVVCACPGCRNAMEAALATGGSSAVAVDLATWLVERGFKPAKEIPDNLCISNSCQDRDGSYLRGIRRLLGLSDDVPAIFTGCCGAGGAVSAFSQDEQSEQIARKLDQACPSSVLVTPCPTCTYTYAFNLMSNPRQIQNMNYLELIFESRFDWGHVFDQLGSMWTGQYGPWLAQVFA